MTLRYQKGSRSGFSGPVLSEKNLFDGVEIARKVGFCG